MNITEEQERIEDEYKKYIVFNNGQISNSLIWLIIFVVSV